MLNGNWGIEYLNNDHSNWLTNSVKYAKKELFCNAVLFIQLNKDFLIPINTLEILNLEQIIIKCIINLENWNKNTITKSIHYKWMEVGHFLKPLKNFYLNLVRYSNVNRTPYGLYSGLFKW